MVRPLSLLLCLSSALLALPASAEVFRVGSRDTQGLVQAIRAANATPGRHVLELEPGGIYALGIPAGTDALPPVTGTLVIEGRGAEIRRYSDARTALLEVAPRGALTLRDLTLAEGSRGALRNFGRLRLERCNVVDSTSTDSPAIVMNIGHFEADDSMIGFNQILGGGRDTATVLNLGRMRLVDSRIEGNTVSRRYPTLVGVAGVLNYGSLTLRNTPLAGNAVLDTLDGLRHAGVVLAGGGELVADDPLLPVERVDTPALADLR